MKKQPGTIARVRDFLGGTLRDLLEKRIFVYLAVAVFFAGAATSLFATELAESTLGYFIESVRQQIVDKPAFSLFVYILSRNAIALFLMLFLGMVFSIFPLLAIYSNGFVVGAALMLSRLSWWKLLPHGIFEVPAMFIAAAYGIWLGLWPFAGKQRAGLRQRLRKCSFVYLRLILPLLVIAGFIEAVLISMSL